MIPAPAITAWSNHVPWASPVQIEQDLLLSRCMVEIANDPYLGTELVFRGGTCLHKLHLPRPYRYSEDLDYVRRNAGGIATITKAVSEIGHALGLSVSTRVGVHPKVYLRGEPTHGPGKLRVKVEVNTYERFPARPIITLRHEVSSSWFTGGADVPTFEPAELVATKIRALYQRRKGRDLFDLWLALTEMNLDPREIVGSFEPYRPTGFTAAAFESNLRNKVDNADFRADLDLLLTEVPVGYTVDAAAELVMTEILPLL